MTVNEIARAEARRLIMESAEHLAGEGAATFTRSALVATMARQVSPRVFTYELGTLRREGKLWQVRQKRGAMPALYSTERPVRSEVEAPDFADGFPSGGTQIGPAWRAIWAVLADGEWHDAFDLGAVGADAGGCLPKTARNLLYPAVKCGYVEPDQRFDATRNRWRSWYRRATASASEAA